MELIVYVTDICLDVTKLFQIASPPTVFVRFLQQLAQIMYVPMQIKNCGTDFQTFALKISSKFFKL